MPARNLFDKFADQWLNWHQPSVSGIDPAIEQRLRIMNRILPPQQQPDIARPQIDMQQVGLIPGDELVNKAIDYTRPISNVARGLVNPIDQSTGLPNVDVAGPVMTGLTGARNAKAILDKVMASKPATAAQASLRFIQNKYPLLWKKLITESEGKFGISTATKDPNSPVFLEGFYSTERKSPTVLDYGPEIGMKRYAETGIHELVHKIQDVLKGRMHELIPPGRFTPAGKQGTYITATVPEEIRTLLPPDIRKAVDETRLNRYMNQPVEVEARQGGVTGAKAFERFSEHVMPQQNKFNTLDVNKELDRSIIQRVQEELFNELGDMPKLSQLGERLGQKGYQSIKNMPGWDNYPLQTVEQLLNLPRPKIYKKAP